ncbi:MAG: response regulator [Calothrix sp. SM1_5_4]|nr:response regulator [Calothrix sp. SM1_5_4]
MLRENPVDLILSDWNMPNMSGIEMVQELRKNPHNAKVPVIFITSENEKSSILKSLVHGVTDYIIKPFPDVTVKQKICQALHVQPNS